MAAEYKERGWMLVSLRLPVSPLSLLPALLRLFHGPSVLGDSLHHLHLIYKLSNDPHVCRFTMSSAIAHVVSFLTRPLAASFPPAAVSSAQLILTASLANMQSATFTLNATSTPPAPLFAASIGAGIPWAAWLTALGSDDILLFHYMLGE
ncbi:hypothetical protein C8R47DRAFT_595970 [Mycena vitilis]|nr:hypothetical protein C8R47DRAFT_595970 [Mycena vitilis]